ncbi:hypothetical protein P43SY_003647 [Pythium insidiosum]|uniref:Elicitin-like protein n=1 Tax=Pythium insidiosum TaxID=114742 RepID=A0AAD5L728_PYTIN|nr:hypothetical protein P43SY_003647 [Pythium insidiosum]
MKFASIIALTVVAVASASAQSIPSCEGTAYADVANSADGVQCSKDTSIDFYRLVPGKTSGCKSDACKAVVTALKAAFPTDCKIDARRSDKTVFGTMISSIVKECPQWLTASANTQAPIAVSPPRSGAPSKSPAASMSATTGAPVATSAPRWASAPPTSAPLANTTQPSNETAPGTMAPTQPPKDNAGPAPTEQPQPQPQPQPQEPQPQPAVVPGPAAAKPAPTPTQKSSSGTTVLAASVPAIAMLATMLA